MSKQTYAVGEIVIPGYVVDIEEEGPIYDQLPSVGSIQEVKAPSRFAKLMSYIKTPDFKLVNIEHVSDIEKDEERIHDQLPSVEEAKTIIPTKSAKFTVIHNKVNVLLLIPCLLLAVGLILIATRNNKENVSVGPLDKNIEKVVQFLRKKNISDEPSLRDPGSPQHEAVRFLAEGDAYGMEITDATADHFVERYVLSLLYYVLKGTEWTYNLKFLSARNHCDWNAQFTTDSGHILQEGVLCDENGYVKKLMIAYNNVQGTLPLEIQFLGKLEALHIQFNPELHGSFPAALRMMPNLKSVGLQHCNLQGELPSWLGELTQLTALALGDNKFHGSVPTSIAQLKNLNLLALDGLGLTGQINTFLNMYQLETLFLEKNVLTGEIGNVLEHWRSMTELDLSDNMLDGAIPKTLFDMEKLVVADLSHNLFDGAIAEDIYQNKQLEFLALHNNAIKGTIPDRIGFLEGLKHLDLSFNALTGILPNTIESMTDLRYLATSVNSFASQQMLDLSKLTNLIDLSMKNNDLYGTIPDWIGGLSTLQLVDLDANRLTGSIPTWMGLLTNLQALLLNRNHLTGTLPSQLAQLQKLNVLLLDSNSFTGNTQAICDSHEFEYFITDCYPGEDGKAPEVECRCCTTCCNDGVLDCNDKQWTSAVDPIWEYGFVRPSYRFDLSNAPAMYSKQSNATDVFDAQP